MDVSSVKLYDDIQTDRCPLLEDLMENQSNQEHVINIPTGIAMSSNNEFLRIDMHEDQVSSTSSRISNAHPVSPSMSRRVHSRTRSAGYGSGGRSALNSGLWISVELFVTLGQIIASIVVLSLSRHEKPRAPLFAWVVGYTAGCLASLPILFWRYCSHVQGHDLTEPGNDNSSQRRISYPPSSLTRISEQENHNRTEASVTGLMRFSSRINGLVNHGKMVLDCFFAVWFVVGNVWIFAGHGSSTDAPNLYRLCIVLLTFNCVGYAMPFILCATICCCLPCILSFLGSTQDLNQTRGASSESINALPKYKFKLKKGGASNSLEMKNGEGGILASGTEMERAVSVEDAVCCICLAKYADNDELRELPCVHFFHVDCVDRWLKINGSCPLCKSEVAALQSASANTDH